jgi:hypothetical protein
VKIVDIVKKQEDPLRKSRIFQEKKKSKTEVVLP